jgi:hypothetical protein
MSSSTGDWLQRLLNRTIFQPKTTRPWSEANPAAVERMWEERDVVELVVPAQGMWWSMISLKVTSTVALKKPVLQVGQQQRPCDRFPAVGVFVGSDDAKTWTWVSNCPLPLALIVWQHIYLLLEPDSLEAGCSQVFGVNLPAPIQPLLNQANVRLNILQLESTDRMVQTEFLERKVFDLKPFCIWHGFLGHLDLCPAPNPDEMRDWSIHPFRRENQTNLGSVSIDP